MKLEAGLRRGSGREELDGQRDAGANVGMTDLHKVLSKLSRSQPVEPSMPSTHDEIHAGVMSSRFMQDRLAWVNGDTMHFTTFPDLELASWLGAARR
jgi:hypothetical protein